MLVQVLNQADLWIYHFSNPQPRPALTQLMQNLFCWMNSKCHSLKMPFRNATFGSNLLLMACRGRGIVGEGLRGEGAGGGNLWDGELPGGSWYLNQTELHWSGSYEFTQGHFQSVTSPQFAQPHSHVDLNQNPEWIRLWNSFLIDIYKYVFV